MENEIPDSTSAPNTPRIPELVDFDMRGLSEPIRYLLHYLKVDFIDSRIPFKGTGVEFAEHWLQQKDNHELSFPNLPFYSDGDVKITESLAIMRHIARKYNLSGDSLQEKATIEMVEGVLNDLRWGLFVIATAPNYKEIIEDYKATIPARLGELNLFIKSKLYVIGFRITYVDFLFFETLDWFKQLHPESFEDPNVEHLKTYHQRIEDIPEINDYRNRKEFPDTPIFSPVAKFGFSKNPDYNPIAFSFRNYVAQYPIDGGDYFQGGE